MTSVKTKGTCCCCQREDVDVWAFVTGAISSEAQHQHCALCYETVLGRACEVPAVMSSYYRLLIADVVYWLLGELKKK